MSSNNLRLSLLLGLIAFFNMNFGMIDAGNCSRWDCCDTRCQLPSAQPCCDDCGFFAGADLLIWTTYQNELDYAVDSVDGTGLPDGKNHFVDYDWDVGYRITAGYRWGCDGWDVRAVYTYFHNKGSNSASADNGDDLKASLFHPEIGDDDAEDAKARVSIDYDVLDFLFSRPYFVSCTHIVRPFFGLRALWLNNKLHVTYEGENFGTGSGAGIVDWKADWEGAGLHAGIEYNLHFNKCLTFYSNFAGSLLAGENRSRLKHLGGSDEVDVKEKQCTGLPGYQLSSGITYETMWCDYCFVLNAGYEMTHWFNLPQVRHYDDKNQGSSTTGSHGQILNHGVTINANVYF